MIGSERLVDATAMVFFARLPPSLRAAGRAVITFDRIQTPLECGPSATVRRLWTTCQCRQSRSFTSADDFRI